MQRYLLSCQVPFALHLHKSLWHCSPCTNNHFHTVAWTKFPHTPHVSWWGWNNSPFPLNGLDNETSILFILEDLIEMNTLRNWWPFYSPVPPSKPRDLQREWNQSVAQVHLGWWAKIRRFRHQKVSGNSDGLWQTMHQEFYLVSVRLYQLAHSLPMKPIDGGEYSCSCVRNE